MQAAQRELAVLSRMLAAYGGQLNGHVMRLPESVTPSRHPGWETAQAPGVLNDGGANARYDP